MNTQLSQVPMEDGTLVSVKANVVFVHRTEKVGVVDIAWNHVLSFLNTIDSDEHTSDLSRPGKHHVDPNVEWNRAVEKIHKN